MEPQASASAPAAVSNSAPSASSESFAAPQASASASGSASAQPAPDAAPFEPPTILLIGDSYMFGGFGKTLDASLRTISKGGDSVWTYSSCGSSPLTWLEGVPTNCGVWNHMPGLQPYFKPGDGGTPRIAKLLDKHHPDLTIIALGVNFIKFDERAAGHIRKLIGELQRVQSRCIWVGPPKSGSFSDAAVERANELIRRNAGDYCGLVWSTELTNYPKGKYMDGTHYDPIAAAKWATKVFEKIRGILGA